MRIVTIGITQSTGWLIFKDLICLNGDLESVTLTTKVDGLGSKSLVL
jgi:hypothetical protein